MSDFIAFLVPAAIGIVASILLGPRQVRFLREKTGDTSFLTALLSGAVFRASRIR